MRRRQVRLDRRLVVVELVEEEELRIVRVAADVELPAAGFGVARRARILRDGLREGIDVLGLDAEFDDEGQQGATP